MNAVDVIIKKRDHKELDSEEITFFIKGLTSGTIPDYQVAAWAMAVLLNGMTDQGNNRSHPGDGKLRRDLGSLTCGAN